VTSLRPALRTTARQASVAWQVTRTIHGGILTTKNAETAKKCSDWKPETHYRFQFLSSPLVTRHLSLVTRLGRGNIVSCLAGRRKCHRTCRVEIGRRRKKAQNAQKLSQKETVKTKTPKRPEWSPQTPKPSPKHITNCDLFDVEGLFPV
jgi:hypothetical protein